MTTISQEQTAIHLEHIAAAMFWDRERSGLIGDLNQMGFSAKEKSDSHGSFIILKGFFSNDDGLVIGKDATEMHDFNDIFKLSAWRYNMYENAYILTEDMTPEFGIAANRQAVLSFIINAIKEI